MKYDQYGHVPGDAAAAMHAENGMILNLTALRSTEDGAVVPAEGPTFMRHASVPHGNMCALAGTVRTYAGPPTIPALPDPAAGLGRDEEKAAYDEV